MRSIKVISILLFLFPLILFFQNCEFIKDFQPTIQVKVMGSGGGDSEGFEGKLVENFYRMIPNHKCESTSSAYGELKIGPDKEVSLKRKTKNQCSANFVPISYISISRSSYNPTLVGYQDGLYEHKNNRPDAATYEQYVEAWCRWKESKRIGIDAVIRFNTNSRKAKATVYLGEKQSGQFVRKKSPSFYVKRVVTNEVVNYSSDSFQLQIKKSEFKGIEYGLFEGRLLAKINSSNYVKEVKCYLGGELDPIISSLKLSNKVLNPKLSPDKSKVVYYLPFPEKNLKKIIATDFRTQLSTPVSPPLELYTGQNGWWRYSYEIAPNSQKLVYMDKNVSSSKTTLSASLLDGSHWWNLSSPQEWWTREFFITEDGKSIVYLGQRRSGAAILKKPINENSVEPIETISQDLSFSTKFVKYDKKANTLYYQARTSNIEQNHNLFYKNLDDRSKPVLVATVSSEIKEIFPIKNPGQVLIRTYSDLFYVDVNKSIDRVLRGHRLLTISPSRKYLTTRFNRKVYFTNNTFEQLTELPVNWTGFVLLGRQVFSLDDSSLYFVSNMLNKNELKQLNTKTGVISPFTISGQTNEIYDLTINSNSGVIYIWLKNVDGVTVDLFSWNPSLKIAKKIKYSNFPLLNWAAKMAISKDGQRLLVQARKSTRKNSNYAYYILYLNDLGKIQLMSDKIQLSNIYSSSIEFDDNFENIVINLYSKDNPAIYWIRF